MKKKLLTLLFLTVLSSLLLTNSFAQNTPDLSFKSLEGSNVNISNYQGKIVIVSFSAKNSPLAQTELTQLERLAAKFANQDLMVLWISTNSAKPKTPNYATNEELQIIASQYPHLKVLRTADEAAFKHLGFDTLPTILVLDQQGKLVGKPHVGIDPQANLANELTLVINRLLVK